MPAESRRHKSKLRLMTLPPKVDFDRKRSPSPGKPTHGLRAAQPSPFCTSVRAPRDKRAEVIDLTIPLSTYETAKDAEDRKDHRHLRGDGLEDRKSTRLNSSHVRISYA